MHRTSRFIRFSARAIAALALAFATTSFAQREPSDAERAVRDLTPQVVQGGGAKAQFTFSNSAPITINSSGNATPYPSVINVPSLPGYTYDVQVRLNGFSHTFSSDVDILLVAPSGKTFTLMSDVSAGLPATNVTLTIDDHAQDGLPRALPLTSGRFRPRNYTAGDTFGAPAPAAPYNDAYPAGSSNFSALRGDNSNGNWSLYIVDDAGGDSGSISGGWSLILTQEYLFLGSSVTINDAAPATPYPSTTTVSNLVPKVLDVQVILASLTHTCPADIDMLLVSPDGHAFEMMSDASACVPGISGVLFTLSDSGANLLDQNSAAVNNSTVRPANYQGTDTFAAPAPAGPYRSAAPSGTGDSFHSAFDGVNPNGVWSLYIVDDAGGDTGSLGTWGLLITTQPEFDNTGIVTISDASAATPYPVSVPVSDVPGQVNRPYVRINGLTHTFPADLDMMLANPAGLGFIFQSDVGTAGAANVTVTWDDDGAIPPVQNGAIPSGLVFQPVNYQTPDTFAAPAPQTGVAFPAPAGMASFASTYKGGSPNGAWSIFVVDDASGDTGTIANGFTLGLVTMDEYLFRDGTED